MLEIDNSTQLIFLVCSFILIVSRFAFCCIDSSVLALEYIITSLVSYVFDSFPPFLLANIFKCSVIGLCFICLQCLPRLMYVVWLTNFSFLQTSHLCWYQCCCLVHIYIYICACLHFHPLTAKIYVMFITSFQLIN